MVLIIYDSEVFHERSFISLKRHQWAAGLGLVLLNRSRVSTFVGQRGESIVDLTWATPAAARRVRDWRMNADSLGELSDHRMVRMELVSTPTEVRRRHRRERCGRRWALTRLDPSALEASLLASTWPEAQPGSEVRILDCESSYNKRLVSEMIHIKRQNFI
ncbi:hypothetical protein ALC57_00987 [Trachymyrmex cornetzi]|uniref:Endonuclease/exonuclease/phosphatase domain-containing protein n=1 Tax=Trachymyrmex cornetzi TaxID=471704 RepID=A0A151JQS8_9HYME|nr:hypothetical protein ALC57_00987 [Trachymyrmex cornetzi]